MMKAMLVVFVLGIIVVAAVYCLGGCASIDPAAEAEQFRASIATGMGWEQVADLKEPRRFYMIDYNQAGPSPRVAFDRGTFGDWMANGKMPDGFGFEYQFTGDHAWELRFDSQGKLMSINDMLTEKQILEGKLFNQ